jgi:hypothetical protein
MNARQKCPVAGPTTGCCSNKAPCVEEKQRVRQPAVMHTQTKQTKKSKYIQTHTHKYACWYVRLYDQRGRIRVRQPAVTYTQKSKQTNMHTCVSVYLYVSEERERISVTLVTTAAQGCASDLSMCVYARMCVLALFRSSLHCVCLSAGAHRDFKTHIHTHTHTSMHVGMYDCMRSESESELGNQLSRILRKANKQKTNMHICVSLYA